MHLKIDRTDPFPKAAVCHFSCFSKQESFQKTNHLSVFWGQKDPTTDAKFCQYTRHSFGSKDSPTCAKYAVHRTTTEHQSEFPKASESVRNNFYLDVYLELSYVVEQATQSAQKILKFLILGGFTLTRFVTKVPSFSIQLPQDCKSHEKDFEVLPIVATLPMS